jgi:hypothetical protein
VDSTGVPALDTVLVWGGAVTLAATIGAGAWRALRGARRIERRVDQFMDDWWGQEARPGVPARPGLMERVSGIEQRLRGVEHELHPNDGASLRDAVDRANARLVHLCPDPPPPDGRPPEGG